MKTRKLPPSSVLSEVRASTSSQTTASEGVPRAARSARSAASEICESICSSAIEPSRADAQLLEVVDERRWRPRGRRRRGSRRPAGCRAAPARKTRLEVEGAASSRSSDLLRTGRPGRRSAGGPSPSVSAAPGRLGCASPMLTDYHLHLRPDEPDTTARALLHGRERRPLPAPRPRRPGSPSWASPSTSTASPRRSSSGATRSGRSRRATTSTPTASSSAAPPLRLGIECDYVPGAEDRTATLLEARDFDYVVGSVHFVGDAAVDHRAGTSGRAAATPTRSGAATSRRSPSARAPASSTSSPTPTWSRSGAAPGRCPSATRASSTSPRSRRSPRAAIAVEVSTAGLRKPVGEIYPARGFAEMCVEAGAAFALSSDAHLPEQVGFGYDRRARVPRRARGRGDLRLRGPQRRLEPLPAPVREDRADERRASATTATASPRAAGWSSAGSRSSTTAGLAGHSDADVLTHAVIDALLGAAGAGRHRHALPRRRRALARRRLDRPAAHRRRHRSPAGSSTSTRR